MSELNLRKGSSRKSAYDLRKSQSSEAESHTLSILVDNEAGVLARVVGLFSGRGYNIESLCVTEVDHTGRRSRITIVSTASDDVIRQIRAQVSGVIPVHDIVDLSKDGPSIVRELALHIVEAKGLEREAAIAAARECGARPLDAESGALVIEQTGTPLEIDELFDRLRPLGLKEVARTGVVGLQLPE